MASGLVAAACMLGAGSAAAQDVNLSSEDGSITITGTLLGFEEGFYEVNTAVGTMRISAEHVTCTGDPCPDLRPVIETVSVTGHGTVAENLLPLMLQSVAVSQGLTPSATIEQGARGSELVVTSADEGTASGQDTFEIRSLTAEDPFAEILDERAQIAVSKFRIGQNDWRRMTNAGAGNLYDFDQERVVAVDSLEFIVHRSNPVQSLTPDEIVGIYTGRITNWSQVGGPDREIMVMGYANDRSTSSLLADSLLDGDISRKTTNITNVDTQAAMVRTVFGNPAAIGHISTADPEGVQLLGIRGSCGIISWPSVFTAKAEDYPLQRRIYMYNRADTLSRTANNLLAFATSPAADAAVAESGFIDLGIGRQNPSSPEARRIEHVLRTTEDPQEILAMRELLLEMFEFDRLSTTFRFGSGSARVEGKSLRDMERLVEYLAVQPRGTQVLLVGFSDSDGAFGANLGLSLGRARQVAAELDQMGGTRLEGLQFEARGYGELAPATCNDTPANKQINRRVEVWIRNP